MGRWSPDLISLTPELWPLVGRGPSRLVPQNSRATAQLTRHCTSPPRSLPRSHRRETSPRSQSQDPDPALCTTNLIRGAHACCLPWGQRKSHGEQLMGF